MAKLKRLKISMASISRLCGNDGIYDENSSGIYPVLENMPVGVIHVIGMATPRGVYEGEILNVAPGDKIRQIKGSFIQVKPLTGERVFIPSDKALITLEGKSYWQMKLNGEIKRHFYLPKDETIELVIDGEEEEDAIDRIAELSSPFFE